MDMAEELDELYEKWLMENYPEEVRTKDDLLEKSCSGFKYDEFKDEIERHL